MMFGDASEPEGLSTSNATQPPESDPASLPSTGCVGCMGCMLLACKAENPGVPAALLIEAEAPVKVGLKEDSGPTRLPRTDPGSRTEFGHRAEAGVVDIRRAEVRGDMEAKVEALGSGDRGAEVRENCSMGAGTSSVPEVEAGGVGPPWGTYREEERTVETASAGLELAEPR